MSKNEYILGANKRYYVFFTCKVGIIFPVGVPFPHRIDRQSKLTFLNMPNRMVHYKTYMLFKILKHSQTSRDFFPPIHDTFLTFPPSKQWPQSNSVCPQKSTVSCSSATSPSTSLARRCTTSSTNTASYWQIRQNGGEPLLRLLRRLPLLDHALRPARQDGQESLIRGRCLGLKSWFGPT